MTPLSLLIDRLCWFGIFMALTLALIRAYQHELPNVVYDLVMAGAFEAFRRMNKITDEWM